MMKNLRKTTKNIMKVKSQCPNLMPRILSSWRALTTVKYQMNSMIIKFKPMILSRPSLIIPSKTKSKREEVQKNFQEDQQQRGEKVPITQAIHLTLQREVARSILLKHLAHLTSTKTVHISMWRPSPGRPKVSWHKGHRESENWRRLTRPASFSGRKKLSRPKILSMKAS